MIGENQDEEGKVEVRVELPKKYPRRNNVLGTGKQFIDDFVFDVENEELYNAMGVENDSTYLLYGVPGTGKTMSINAINNTVNKDLYTKLILRQKKGEDLTANDFNLLTFHYDIGKFGTAYINRGSRKIQNFFDHCFLYSQCAPVLVAIDEADALFSSRKSKTQSHSEDRKNLETLMKNMQVAHDTPNMNVVLITNLVDDMDEASIRSGRVDKRVKFELPNYDERLQALQYEVKRVNGRALYTVLRKVDYEDLATESDGLNYADITNVVQSSVRDRIKDLRGDKKVTLPYATGKRIMDNIKKSPKKGLEKRIGFK